MSAQLLDFIPWGGQEEANSGGDGAIIVSKLRFLNNFKLSFWNLAKNSTFAIRFSTIYFCHA